MASSAVFFTLPFASRQMAGTNAAWEQFAVRSARCVRFRAHAFDIHRQLDRNALPMAQEPFRRLRYRDCNNRGIFEIGEIQI
jgi:hypothetical protein